MTSNVEFISTPDGTQAKRIGRASISIGVEDIEPEEDLDVYAEISLWKGSSVGTFDERIGNKDAEVTENDIINATFNVKFGNPGDYQLTTRVQLRYYGAPGYIFQEIDQEIDVTSDTFTIIPFEEEEEITTLEPPTEPAKPDTYKDAWTDRTEISITGIESDGDTGDVPSRIEFTPRGNPNISIDTAGRFAKHNIIGGDIVRQKIGEDTVDISVEGVCDEDTAKDIDKLRDAKRGTFVSDRKTMKVQFGSTSTDPHDDGGAVDMDTGDILYNYTINLIGVE